VNGFFFVPGIERGGIRPEKGRVEEQCDVKNDPSS
jgi:hypothetical protein